MNELLTVETLNKIYGDKHVVKDISFQIHDQEILCLLGPNSAGKSTTMNIICGLFGYENGNILWKEKPIASRLNAFKTRLGVVPQNLALYELKRSHMHMRNSSAFLSGLKRNGC